MRNPTRETRLRTGLSLLFFAGILLAPVQAAPRDTFDVAQTDPAVPDPSDGRRSVNVCGNDVVETGETCDPPGESAGGNGNVCRGDCTVCGDGIVDAVEACDDGNGTNGDGCESNCTITFECGNGIFEPGEQCDHGGESPACDTDCTVAICGDAMPNAAAGEQCDDGNSVEGDGCDNDCTMSEPLLVTLESMSARLTARGVAISWATSMEIDTIGFRVLRETPGSRRDKALDVVMAFLPSDGHGLAGASYEVLDASDLADDAIHYYLEDLDIFGKVTRHGPIAVERARERGVLRGRTR